MSNSIRFHLSRDIFKIPRPPRLAIYGRAHFILLPCTVCSCGTAARNTIRSAGERCSHHLGAFKKRRRSDSHPPPMDESERLGRDKDSGLPAARELLQYCSLEILSGQAKGFLPLHRVWCSHS